MKTAPASNRLRLLVAALLSASVCMAVAADPKASQFYEDALIRYEKKDLKGAIVQLRNAIKLDRKLLQSHVLLGKVLLANGEVNAAQVAFEEALNLGVNPAEVVLPLAETFSTQGKPDLLLSDARFSITNLPVEARSRLLLLKAAAASDLGRPRDALKLLEEVRALNLDAAASWAAEVPIRVRSRQLAEAKAAADKAVALDPKSSQAAYQQASVAHVTGDLKTAVQLYTRAMTLKPDHVDALVARAGIYIDQGDLARATADVQAARKADPKDPRSAYMAALLAERAGRSAEVKQSLVEITNLLDPLPMDYIRYRPQVLMLGGMAHFSLNQFEKAQPYLEMVVRQDADSAVSKLLARIYLKQNQTDKAVSALEAYLRTRPDDSQAKMLLASSQMALGRNARAAQLMEEALKKEDNPSMRALLGMSLVGAGKLEPGAAELEATLKKDPGHVPAGVSLAGLYIASGQGAKAVAVAEGLVKRQPGNASLHNLLGSAHAAQGDGARARAAFMQAATLDPKFVQPVLNLAKLDIDERAFPAATARLNQILAKDDKHIEAALETARMMSAQGKHDDALRWLQRADDNSGNRLQPGLQMVEFHLARNRPDLAKETIKRLQGKAPEALAVLLAQSRVQLANKETAEARSTLTRATTLVAYDPAALTQIADLQLSAGNLAGAAHALDKALSVKPDHLRARGLRSNVYLLQGEQDKAEKLARGILASHPKSSLGHGLMGDLALARSQLPAAVEAYRRAHQIDKSSDSVMRLFGALDLTQRPAAVALAEQWLRDKPNDTRVWRALADLHARSGNLAAARSGYESLLKANPRDAEAMNNLAIVMVMQRDPGATKVAEQALALSPQTPHIIGTAGWAAFHGGQTDRALQLLRDARLRDPANAGTRYFLGVVLAQQGRKTEAAQELEAALKGGTQMAYAKDAEALLKTLK